MRNDDEARDRELADALHLLDRATPVAPSDAQRFVRRVVASAGPLLDARRGYSGDWWEYPAEWARTLIPLGIAAALVAASCILWATSARLPVSTAVVASARYPSTAETAGMAPQQVLDLLVTPVEQGAVPPRARGGR